MSNVARFLALPLAVAALVLAVMPGCSDDIGVAPNEGSSSGGKKDGGSSGSGNDTICLLNNCDTDRDCADCSEGATTCLQKEHRCVACGEGTNGKSCDSGKTCSQYGSCVTNGIVCTEDANHVPTITCKNTADCGACSPKFRVCDTGTGKCVGCSDANTVNCQSTDTCISGTCTPKCPAACDNDGQCQNCGGPAAPAHACNKHICAECSDTVKCPDGKSCDTEHGKCVATCGVGGTPGKSSCGADGACGACTGTTKCKLPANHTDGDTDGVCAAPATGCSDIGKGIIVLPAPFDRFTNTCSVDADCKGQGIDINAGKLLADATGLGIKDGNIPYSMNACASVEVLDKSCGLCVPCKVDTDCTDIDVGKVAGDIFGPVGSVAAALLLDKAFGPNDHKIHMYCQNVAGDYGVCLPCGDILHRCAQSAEDAPAQGTCGHDVCTKGDALGRNCGDCQAKVCAKDPYCCTKEWDAACLTDVDQFCTDKTCTPNSCAFRPQGWFCNSPNTTEGGYRCLGDGKDPSGTTAEGYQCATGKCTQEDSTNIKSKAVLCTTESDGDPTCPLGSKGKPKCVQ